VQPIPVQKYCQSFDFLNAVEMTGQQAAFNQEDMLRNLGTHGAICWDCLSARTASPYSGPKKEADDGAFIA